MKKIRFGILGAAKIADRFCDVVRTMEDVEVVAVSSRTDGKAYTFAQQQNIPFWYSTYEEMLQNPEVDAVYIATTHNFHYDNLMLCLDYYKPALCEKSCLLTQKQAETVFQRAREKGVFVMEAMWIRFLPAYTKAREWIANGRIGKLAMIGSSIGFHATNDPQHRLVNPALAGGALYDIGVYAISAATYFAGSPVCGVKAMLSYGSTGVDVVDSILLRFENECIASLQCNFLTNMPSHTTIYGEKGYIVMSDACGARECRLYVEGEEPIIFDGSYENGFQFEIAEMLHCLRENRIESSIMPHAATIECTGIFDKCLKEMD